MYVHMDLNLYNISLSYLAHKQHASNIILLSCQVTKPKNKVERMFNRQNQNILSEHYGKLVDHEGDKFGTSDDDDDDFMTLKRVNHELESREDEVLTDYFSHEPLGISNAHYI